MNDRYLYRAKRKNWRELPREKWWVTGYLVNKKCGEYNTVGFEEFKTMIIVTSFSDGGIEWCYIDEDTLCQCTGLKDKNGKLIWENDVVKCKCGIAVVVWDKSEWRIKWVKDTIWRKDLHFWVNDENESGVEVIGSAIDNPELLEVEE